MFEFFLQATVPTTSDNFVALISAIAILIGAIGGIAATVATVVSQKTKGRTQELAKQIVYVSEATGEVMKEIVNNENKIKGVGNVIYALAPQEAKIYMDKSNISVKTLTDDVYKTTTELNKLATYLPTKQAIIIDANHNGIPDEIEIIDEETKKD